jgi:hypothetical protein
MTMRTRLLGLFSMLIPLLLAACQGFQPATQMQIAATSPSVSVGAPQKTATTTLPASKAPLNRLEIRETEALVTIQPPFSITPIPNPQGKDVVEVAIQDLAGKLGIDPVEIELVSVDVDELPAKTLGCSSKNQPGAPVVPAFVSGKIIRLRAGGELYEYHASGRQVVYCSELLGINP